MTNRKKKGIILIVAGVVIPLAVLFYTTGYQDGAGFFKNLIEIRVPVNLFNKYKIGVPYRFFVALGVILVFLGIKCFDLMGIAPQDSNSDDKPE